MNKILSIIIVSFLFIYHSNAQQAKQKSFVVNGTFVNDFSGYLHMDYEGKEDSVLVVDNHFTFKGKLTNSTSAYAFFSTRGKGILSTNSNEFYLENSTIDIVISVEQKKI